VQIGFVKPLPNRVAEPISQMTDKTRYLNYAARTTLHLTYRRWPCHTLKLAQLWSATHKYGTLLFLSWTGVGRTVIGTLAYVSLIYATLLRMSGKRTLSK
jgi:hypothetical protein